MADLLQFQNLGILPQLTKMDFQNRFFCFHSMITWVLLVFLKVPSRSFTFFQKNPCDQNGGWSYDITKMAQNGILAILSSNIWLMVINMVILLIMSENAIIWDVKLSDFINSSSGVWALEDSKVQSNSFLTKFASLSQLIATCCSSKIFLVRKACTYTLQN